MRQSSGATQAGSTPYFQEIQDALSEPGCPLCILAAETAERYLDAVLWELVNDIEVRAELNRSRGYCQQHGWLLVRAGASLGVAILMRDVVKTLLDTMEANAVEDTPEAAPMLRSLLRRLRGDPKGDQREVDAKNLMISPEPVSEGAPLGAPRRSAATAKLAAELAPEAPCPVCSLVQARERDHIRAFLAYLDGPGALADAYLQSDGLCLVHFQKALAQAPCSSQGRRLADAQKLIWERLHADLGEFIRKSDQRFRDETFGTERDAWRRALTTISGPPPRSQSARQGLT